MFIIEIWYMFIEKKIFMILVLLFIYYYKYLYKELINHKYKNLLIYLTSNLRAKLLSTCLLKNVWKNSNKISYLLRYIILYYKKLVGKWLKDVWVCHIYMGGFAIAVREMRD